MLLKMTDQKLKEDIFTNCNRGYNITHKKNM